MCKDDKDSGSAIEVDDERSGSDYSSIGGSSTDSLSSSVNQYMIENGRRYHCYYGPDKNLMPTDEIEQDRLDIHHEVLRLIAGNKLYEPPLENPQRVLDLGTGTGIWAIDFADQHPESEVIGIDLSPIQPHWVPPNCRFEIDDAELDWTMQRNSFDFIHARNILFQLSNWTKLLSQIHDHLKPGAWVQFGELEFKVQSDDDSMPPTWPPAVAVGLANKAIGKSGRTPPTGPEIAKMVRESGFEEVKLMMFKQPLGTWPKNKDLKQAGGLYVLNSETAYHSYGLALFTRFLGMSVDEATEICDAAREATMHRARKEKVHDYIKYYVVIGRKPLEAEE